MKNEINPFSFKFTFMILPQIIDGYLYTISEYFKHQKDK